MKNFISLSALFLSLSLTAQSNPATWYLNDSSLNGIQSPTNTASGSVSIAMGYETEASGSISTAMGRITTASGDYSTAMGSGSTASGDYSTAMGIATKAEDFMTFALGAFNKSNESLSPNLFSFQNTAFVIGNGGFDSNGNYLGEGTRSNAFEVLFDGTTTIAGSITAPTFIGDGSQLTNLPFSYNSNEAGGIEIADYTTASGSRAFAVGRDSQASGSSSTAMGRGTIASGDNSTAMGSNTEATGDWSTSMGWLTDAEGTISTAIGRETKASGENSTAMGRGTTASGTSSTAMGHYTTASGTFSTAMGRGTTAKDHMTFALGTYNKIDDTPNPNEFSFQNTAFVIGNGGFNSNGNYLGPFGPRSNAFEVLFDGTTTIAGDLNVNSDARLKANIISLGSTLSKLLQIDGKSYTMKKDESEKQKIGLLAQDIEKVFPELVSESHGVKSVNYQGLVPVLINALKEQDAMMKEQESKYLKQEKRLERLERLVAAMD